jgi:hypothetical protein
MRLQPRHVVNRGQTPVVVLGIHLLAPAQLVLAPENPRLNADR